MGNKLIHCVLKEEEIRRKLEKKMLEGRERDSGEIVGDG